jgi:hypothetical protein
MCGKERQVHEEPTVDSALYDDIKARIFDEIKVQSVVKGKLARKKAREYFVFKPCGWAKIT